MPQRLLTTAEVARIFGCSRSTICRMVRRGELRAAVDEPNGLLFDLDEVTQAYNDLGMAS